MLVELQTVWGFIDVWRPAWFDLPISSFQSRSGFSPSDLDRCACRTSMLDLFCQLQDTLSDNFVPGQTITQQQRSPVTFCFHLGFLAGVIYYFNIESVTECEVLDISAKFF